MTHLTTVQRPIESLESRILLSLASPDPSFSRDGTQTYPFKGSQYTSAAGFDIQPDGKVIVAGNTRGRDQTTQIILARVNPNGTLDRTFGQKGRSITLIRGPAGQNQLVAQAEQVRIQPDGKILVAGYLDANWAVFRFNSNGSLDKSFDRDGVQTFKSTLGEAVFDMELLPRGKILVGGWAEPGRSGTSHSRDFGLMRLNSNGSLDRSFGSKGYVLTDLGDNDRLSQLAVDAAGNIVAVGLSGSASPTIVLVRYRPNGTIDNSFAAGGKFTTTLAGNDASPASLQILSHGRILLGGSANGDAFLMRLDSHGALDQGFGSRGLITFNLGSIYDRAVILRAGPTAITVLGAALSLAQSGPPPEDSKQFLLHFRGDGSADPSSPTREFSLTSNGGQMIAGGARLLPNNRLLALFTSRNTWADGDMILARFNASGSPDKRFASRGAITIDDTGPLKDTPLHLVTQPDGKSIVLAQLDMYNQTQYALLRLRPDGKVDKAFGVQGRILLQPNQFFEHITALGLDSAGKIILAGDDGSLERMNVQRFNANGSPDNSFGHNSRISVPAGATNPDLIIALPGQKLLLAGSKYAGLGSSTIAITRLSANGSPDNSFDQDGTASADFDSLDIPDHLFLHPDGKVTVVGTTSTYQDLGPPFVDPKIFIARLNPSGSFDTSFSQDGKLLIDDLSYLFDARLLADGGVILLAPGDTERDFQIRRYKPDGSPDGKTLRRASDRIIGAWFEADGRIVMPTASSTLRLAADGAAIPSSSPGPAIPNMYIVGNTTVFSVKTITPAHKLLVAGVDADGDLTLGRYLLD
jgi:uncharacterized delta-60 repeat protein